MYKKERVYERLCLRDGKSTIVFYKEKIYFSKYSNVVISCVKEEITKDEYLEFKK